MMHSTGCHLVRSFIIHKSLTHSYFIIIIIIIIQLAVDNQAFNCRYSHHIISCIPVFLDSNFFCFVCFCKRKIKHIHCSCEAVWGCFWIWPVVILDLLSYCISFVSVTQVFGLLLLFYSPTSSAAADFRHYSAFSLIFNS